MKDFKEVFGCLFERKSYLFFFVSIPTTGKCGSVGIDKYIDVFFTLMLIHIGKLVFFSEFSVLKFAHPAPGSR